MKLGGCQTQKSDEDCQDVLPRQSSKEPVDRLIAGPTGRAPFISSVRDVTRRRAGEGSRRQRERACFLEVNGEEEASVPAWKGRESFETEGMPRLSPLSPGGGEGFREAAWLSGRGNWDEACVMQSCAKL